MLRSIIRKEMLENLLSYKFSIIVILSTILSLVSIFVMYGDYCLAMDNYELLQPKSGRDFVIIRPTPLSIFAKGLEENLCRSYEVDDGQIKVSGKQQSVNKLFRLFTTPDLLYIVKVILSLCAMLFAFDIVCGEKETGTLRQTISNTVKRPILIIGKWIGGFTSFILPFFIVVLFGTIIVTISPIVDINGENWAKLSLFLLSSVIYLAVFFSLGLFISCVTHQSSTSLIISLFVWAVLVFLIPNLGNILARQFIKLPTVQQLEQKSDQVWISSMFENDHGIKSGDSERMGSSEKIAAEYEKLMEDYHNRANRLVKLSQSITCISPAAVFTFLATDIMTTGISEERKLKRAVLQDDNDEGAFSYSRSSVKEVLSSGGLSNCLILILFNILFFVSGYVAFLRYDVR